MSESAAIQHPGSGPPLAPGDVPSVPDAVLSSADEAIDIDNADNRAEDIRSRFCPILGSESATLKKMPSGRFFVVPCKMGETNDQTFRFPSNAGRYAKMARYTWIEQSNGRAYGYLVPQAKPTPPPEVKP